ncbi:VCBS repeat-containing protein [Aurantibacter crassamenti]|uniref:VCBS repeat-containing protein n=1 Tax=Aurantibacter crassamenti TaxID=1837375 RepID=UPI0019392CE6|nr:VCBS repeat-containing protein [Aurantibacter crassamenti]MBM1106855.1 VCBS repeat-containing protein [Aurantibacter crassamenti]
MKSLIYQSRFFYLLIALIICSCTTDDKSKQFSLLSRNTTGINFKNLLKETEKFNVLEYGYLYNGGGVSIGDLNNDGLPDIYFTGNMVGSQLYINQGDFEFKEVAKKAGVFADGLWNTGTTMADVNADGYLDIYVCRSAAKDPERRKNLLFINNKDLTFTESAAEYGIADSGYSTQGAFFDYDKDGDLDLYVLNHSTQEYAGFGQITASLKNKKNNDYSDKLYKNENGNFTDVSDASGLISNVLGFGLGIAISDINNDTWPDVYVSNDYNEQDYLYINNQDGTFSESLEKFIGHTSLFSMGSDIADINNDGYTDIMTLDMLPEGNDRQKMVSGPDNYDKYSLLAKSGFYNQTMRNMLQVNNQGESFSEVGQFSGISNTDWSWSALFPDLNNDGYKDLFITNGYKRDYTNMDFMNFAVQEKIKENKTGQRIAIMELLEKVPPTIEENYTYKNNGDLTFTKMNSDWGLNQKSLSNGAAYADLDNDGDLDLVVNNIDEEPFVYRNNSELDLNSNFLKVKLKGDNENTFGIGAKISLTIGDKIISQEMMPTRGYQSSVDFNLVFGLGEAKEIDKIEIIWPDSKVQVLERIKANKEIKLNQADATNVPSKNSSPYTTLFTDVSADSPLIAEHNENNYVDFKRQQLLPHKLSTQGPKIAKGDVNNDGLEDIFICGAKGSLGKLMLQSKNGEFLDSKFSFEDDLKYEDTAALFFDADNDNDLDLYVVSAGNEYEPGSPELQDRIYFNNGYGKFTKKEKALPTMLTNGSCVVTSDIDNDGDLDLFVGGRVITGQYPTAPRSYVLINDGSGKFTDATAEVNIALVNPGMVTDAVWADIDNDEQKDLIIVGEFMPIRIFKNNKGELKELENTNILNSEGWWNTIEAADFDNDGDIDFVLGNFGLNSQLKASPEEPVSVYAKDFDGNGSIDPILCSYKMGKEYPEWSKDDLVGQLSGLKAKYINYSDYAEAQITDIFSTEELKDAQVLKAVNFSSSYVENLGDYKFDLKPLPNVAQFAPIYSILPNDFNNDGNLDILLAGNFFGNRVKYGRYDASKGDILLGDGQGNFSAITNEKSGLNLNGEVRDIISVKNYSGIEMVLFARNNAAVKVYKKEN